MKKVVDFFSRGYVFYALYALFFAVLAIVFLFTSKSALHLWLNQFHHPVLDKFFLYATELGNGLFVMVIVIIFLFYRYRYALGIFVTFALSGIIAQIIKHLSNLPRPIKYFENIADLHLVEGAKMLTTHSFPSGHAASAFALCLSLAIIMRSRGWQILMFMLAITIAYSRVYLSQHFLIDIWAGSAIGTLVAACYWYYEQKLRGRWLEHSILSKKSTQTN